MVIPYHSAVIKHQSKVVVNYVIVNNNQEHNTLSETVTVTVVLYHDEPADYNIGGCNLPTIIIMIMFCVFFNRIGPLVNCWCMRFESNTLISN